MKYFIAVVLFTISTLSMSSCIVIRTPHVHHHHRVIKKDNPHKHMRGKENARYNKHVKNVKKKGKSSEKKTTSKARTTTSSRKS